MQDKNDEVTVIVRRVLGSYEEFEISLVVRSFVFLLLFYFRPYIMVGIIYFMKINVEFSLLNQCTGLSCGPSDHLFIL